MAASQFKLDNIIGIIDKNSYQQTGANSEIMSVGDLAAKWDSFGWDVLQVDGHNVGELYDSLSKENTLGKPLVVVARTIKGKGFSFAENNNAWHHAVLSRSQHELAVGELNLPLMESDMRINEE